MNPTLFYRCSKGPEPDMNNIQQLKRIFRDMQSEISRYFAGIDGVTYSYKSGKELVTFADTEINEIITSLIKENFPEHSIISEEGNGNRSDSEFCWYVDPIDNSVGFIAGETEFSVSVSLKRGDEHIRSMVLNPSTGETFEAYNDSSMMNGNKISVYSGSLGELTRGISTCAYVTKTRIPLAREVMGRIFEARLPLRISGGSALDLCRVAEGKSYAHVCLGAHHWDVEAGIHILKNAGGAIDILEVFPEREALAFIGAGSRETLDELRKILSL